MVPFKKILSQIMNGLHTNHFCSMGTIMKFVINMEVLDAELERIEQISLIPFLGFFAVRLVLNSTKIPHLIGPRFLLLTCVGIGLGVLNPVLQLRGGWVACPICHGFVGMNSWFCPAHGKTIFLLSLFILLRHASSKRHDSCHSRRQYLLASNNSGISLHSIPRANITVVTRENANLVPGRMQKQVLRCHRWDASTNVAKFHKQS